MLYLLESRQILGRREHALFEITVSSVATKSTWTNFFKLEPAESGTMALDCEDIASIHHFGSLR